MSNPIEPTVEIRSAEDPSKEVIKHALVVLREENKALAAEQRRLRLEGKPSRGKIHKDEMNAVHITAIINLSRSLRGLPDIYRAVVKCSKCGHTIKQEDRKVHNKPSSSYWSVIYYQKTESLVASLGLEGLTK